MAGFRMPNNTFDAVFAPLRLLDVLGVFLQLHFAQGHIAEQEKAFTGHCVAIIGRFCHLKFIKKFRKLQIINDKKEPCRLCKCPFQTCSQSAKMSKFLHAKFNQISVLPQGLLAAQFGGPDSKCPRSWLYDCRARANDDSQSAL
jgi:hypothetical protein